METTSQTTKVNTAGYELAMSYNFINEGLPQERRYYVRINEKRYTEFLVKDFLPQQEVDLITTDTKNGTVILRGRAIL